ncbi:DUF2785 domain-containing protein [Ornithinibacillus salinisoli]|uniref:DUF2785 domain-containing protein n=1 Tax=Ornithinibacillus salinisoli TaxID=1848459 RepID=A0ABW4VVR1_9BACI
MEKSLLKQRLLELKYNNFQDLDVDELLPLMNAMLKYIGDTDPDLRDTLIYSSFSSLILEGRYSNENLRKLLVTSVSNDYLFYGIGRRQDDSVFKRSFSTLIIALILHVNIQKNFLSLVDMEEVADRLINYLEKEVDVRGLVDEKGWAHSIAHVADAMDELVNQKLLLESYRKKVMQTIINKMCYDDDYYLFEENERMVVPVISILRQGTNQFLLIEGIRQIAEDLREKYSSDEKSCLIYRYNFKQFLQSLYFHLEAIDLCEDIRREVKKALKVINQPYYAIT